MNFEDDKAHCSFWPEMVKIRRRRLALFACFLSFGFIANGCGCNDKSSGVQDGEAVDASVYDGQTDSGKDAEVEEEGGVDGKWPPEPVSFDFCDEPFFKLPIDGQTEISHVPTIAEKGVIYTKRPVGTEYKPCLYYFNLETCKEYQLTIEDEKAGGAWISENKVVYRACHDFCSKDPPKGSDLFMIDLEDWSKSRVLEEDLSIVTTKFNGRHVVLMEYEPGDWEPNLPPTRLAVWDMATEEKVALTPWGAGSPYFAISERFLAWSGYFGLEGQVGKDVAYYDLQTGEMVHLDSTLPWHQMGIDVWGDNIVWAACEDGMTPPFHTKLYNIKTQVETTITDDEEAFSYATIHKSLVTHLTTKYRDPSLQGMWPVDLEIHDIEKGTSRRLTTESGKLNQIRIFEPYLLTGDVLGTHPNMNDYYIANLRKLGVTDEDGNLLEGDPVITPP